MVLGLLLAGIAVGAVVAGLWIAAGGSFLVAIVLYSVTSTAFIICIAVMSFVVGDRRQRGESGSSGSARQSEQEEPAAKADTEAEEVAPF